MTYLWHGDEYLRGLQDQLGRNLEKAAIHLKTRIKENINRSQAKTGKGSKTRGIDPSLPGEFPKKLYGYLQRSISHEMEPDKQTAYVGSGIPVALFLEVGTSKMAARPFIRRTMLLEKEVISKIIATGSR